MNIGYFITHLESIKAQVEVLLAELDDEKKKINGKKTWDQEFPLKKEVGE